MDGLVKFLARLFVLRIVIKRLREDRAKGNTRPMNASGAPTATAPRPSPSPRAGAEGVPSQTKGGPGPESPLELEGSDWKATGKRTLAEIKEDRVTLAAAGMAYYFFLALFPALIAIIGIYDLTGFDSRGLIESIRGALPEGAGSFVTEALADAEKPSDGASLTAAIAGIALALWSASSGMVAMQSGLNIAYDVPADRKFIGKRGIALALILVTILLGAFPSPFFQFGEGAVFDVIAIVLSVVAVIVLFSLYYYLAPKRESPRWTWVSAGGIAGGGIWIIASLAFGYYVSEFGNYGKTYGAAAGIVVLIFWLFLTSISVLVGGELNAEIERQAERRKRAG
jgi:membrane protein